MLKKLNSVIASQQAAAKSLKPFLIRLKQYFREKVWPRLRETPLGIEL